MKTLVSIILGISALAVIISVLMQEPEQGGLGALDGSAQDAWGASRGSSKKETLRRVTTVASVVFLVSAVVMSAIS